MQNNYKNTLSKVYVLKTINSQRNFFEKELSTRQLGTPQQKIDSQEYSLGYIQGIDVLEKLIIRIPESNQINVPEPILNWLEMNKGNHHNDLIASIESTLSHPNLGYNDEFIKYLFDESLTPTEKNKRTSNIMKLWYFKGMNEDYIMNENSELKPLFKFEVMDEINKIKNEMPDETTMFEQAYYSAFRDYGHLVEQLIQPNIEDLNPQLCDFYDSLIIEKLNLFEALYEKRLTIEDFENYAIKSINNHPEKLEYHEVQQLIYKAIRGWMYGYKSVVNTFATD